MHELSIAQSIFEAVQAKAAECNASSVKCIWLKIGEASGVVPDALTFCFQMLTQLDPVLAGVQVFIEEVPHRAHCRYCDKEFAVANFIAACPICHEWSGEILSGTELQIVEMEIDTP